MNRTGREKDVNTLALCRLQGTRRALDVLGAAARESRDDRSINFARNRID